MKKINIAHSSRPHLSPLSLPHLTLNNNRTPTPPFTSTLTLPFTLTLTLAFFLFLSTTLSAQTTDKALDANRAYTGAKANKKSYHAIYQLDSNDPKIIEKAIRNLRNALTDPRLDGKIQIELVTFAGGTEASLKGSKYEAELKDLVEKGVIVAQCNNSLRERQLDRDKVYDFIAIVPSGNGELIIRQSEGWAVIKP